MSIASNFSVRQVTFGFRALAVIVVGLSLQLLSCSDDLCLGSPYETVSATIDSADWILRRGDSARRGRLSVDWKPLWGGRWIDMSGRVVGTSQVPRFEVAHLVGRMVASGRSGLPDTTIFFELDSVGTSETDPRKAGIRMEFRSMLGERDWPDWNPEGSSSVDSSSTYWIVRGEVECSIPILPTLRGEESYSCQYHASSEDDLSLHMRVEVVKHPAERYECNGQVY